ncbi:ClpXP protease specificity-enhancing factor [Polynucleobacter sp. MWH-Braz-FAM2G]|uniref:ClpXP protease specificity-enhancing factor n=1 Tax=Polynucleobacter sp. MWH-Braz-FAM2G TaxID=1855883 RepID=UPI001BFE6576|nr:ClpXP protease specificity-enhancing factor [Polynucleobacter sp. MWH-Braz-FAM2G]QWD90896.1 ClpXP protease specificity-enhancing factor [Polynucleobacter sp. MWH-Braz-FAM2G]
MSDIPSNKPYLIRALHQWCTDFGFTPFIAVFVDTRVEVPMEFVKNDEIVLNLSLEACHQLQMENDWISFQARFGGVPRKIMVPVSHVLAIYARENGQGMSFPFDPSQSRDLHIADSADEGSEKPKIGRPSLKIVK